MKEKRHLIILIVIFLLVACSDERLYKKIAQILEESYELEKEFVATQDELLQLEEKDLELYDTIIKLEATEEKKLQELADEAFANITKRRELIEKEKASIEASYNAFKKIETYRERIADEEMKQLIVELEKVMAKRHKRYVDVYEKYVLALDLTEKIYQVLLEPKQNEELYQAIDRANKSYESLFAANDAFNEATKEYNQLKETYFQKIR